MSEHDHGPRPAVGAHKRKPIPYAAVRLGCTNPDDPYPVEVVGPFRDEEAAHMFVMAKGTPERWDWDCCPIVPVPVEGEDQ